MYNRIALLENSLEILNTSGSNMTATVIHSDTSRCLQCEDAPCFQACPAGIDVSGFIRKIADENDLGGIRALRGANVLAGGPAACTAPPNSFARQDAFWIRPAARSGSAPCRPTLWALIGKGSIPCITSPCLPHLMKQGWP